MESNDYRIGYVVGYDDGTRLKRRPFQSGRTPDYRYGYEVGYEDAVYNEKPEYEPKEVAV